MLDQKTYLDAKWAQIALTLKRLETDPRWTQRTEEEQDQLGAGVIGQVIATMIAELRADGQDDDTIASIAADFATRMHVTDDNRVRIKEEARLQFLEQFQEERATVLPFPARRIDH